MGTSGGGWIATGAFTKGFPLVFGFDCIVAIATFSTRENEKGQSSGYGKLPLLCTAAGSGNDVTQFRFVTQ